ncbi:hypothetical protein LZ554_002700 [Drepanopeziza brunnea f. sp. 'monogermtubi']|nr:hypothetical protein LZ554_002700 [Drepanopeziza brunnea f. sp. 'monogermtubi']
MLLFALSPSQLAAQPSKLSLSSLRTPLLRPPIHRLRSSSSSRRPFDTATYSPTTTTFPHDDPALPTTTG